MSGIINLNLWCGEFIECAKSFHDLCHLHRVTRERDNAVAQLEAIDHVLPWHGTGFGRVETIGHLLGQETACE